MEGTSKAVRASTDALELADEPVGMTSVSLDDSVRSACASPLLEIRPAISVKATVASVVWCVVRDLREMTPPLFFLAHVCYVRINCT